MPRILEERSTEDYEPTQKEIEEYAEWLGIDPKEDADLLWIARQGLRTPLVKPWKACESGEGEIFYFNPETGESRWDHPCDEHLQRLYAAERAKKAAAASGRPPKSPAGFSGSPKGSPDEEGHRSGGGSNGEAVAEAAAEATAEATGSSARREAKEQEPQEQPIAQPPDGGQPSERPGADLPADLPALAPIVIRPPAQGGPRSKAPLLDDLLNMPLDLSASSRKPPPLAPPKASSSSSSAPVAAAGPGEEGTVAAPDVGHDGKVSGGDIETVSLASDPPEDPNVVHTPREKRRPGGSHAAQQGSAEATGLQDPRIAGMAPDLPALPLEVDSLSPQTPQLTDILTAELKPEDSKDQLSLWSQIEEGGKDDPVISTPALKPRPESSLELSSLTAVLERSPEVGGCDDAKGMVEELQRLQQDEVPTSSRRDAGEQTEVDSRAERLEKELAATKRECENLQAEVTAASVREKEDEGPSGAKVSATGPSPMEDLTAVNSTVGNGGHECGPFGSTIKLRWEEAQEAQSRAEASSRRLEQFQEELTALSERVRAVESSKPLETSACSKPGASLKEAIVAGNCKQQKPERQAAGDKARAQLQGAEDGRCEQLSFEVRELRAATADSERLLHEGRLALQREQASHAAVQASLRESQNEVLRLRSQVKHKDAEVDCARAEIRRLQVELTNRDDENHQLQLQLHSRDAELSQLRVQLAAQSRQSDAILQQQRLELREREQKVQDQERLVQERERAAAEVELRAERRQREARSTDHQRAEVGAGLRTALSEAALQAGARHPGGMQTSPTSPLPFEAVVPLISATRSGPEAPEAGGAALGSRRSRSARPATTRLGSGELQVGNALPAGSGGESISSPDNEAAALPVTRDDIQASDLSAATQQPSPEARCLFESPSPGSSIVSLREGREGGAGSHSQGIGDDAHEETTKSAAGTTANLGTNESPAGPAFFNARSLKEMSDLLSTRRRELRSEHSELEEERKQWRTEVRRQRRAASAGGSGKVDSEARSALDARAAALNRAIGEYRALEQFFLREQKQRSASGGAGSGEQAARSSRQLAPARTGGEEERAGKQRLHHGGAIAMDPAVASHSSRHKLQTGSCPASPCPPSRAGPGGA